MNLKKVTHFYAAGAEYTVVFYCYIEIFHLPTLSSLSRTVFQSEEALLATRLVLPHSSGCCAFLYNDELVYACSTGMGRLAVPEEKISFSSPGEKEIT